MPNPQMDRTEEMETSSQAIGGRNAVRELLAGERDVDKIFVARGEHTGSLSTLIAEARKRGIPVIESEKRKLDLMTGGDNHQGIVALASEKKYATLDDVLAYAAERGEKPFLIVLDGIEDPHNLGAIIRNAECAGAHGVVIPKRRATGVTATVAKSAAGALEYMRVVKVTNIAATLDELKERGLWIYGADMDGEAYDRTDLSGSVALVLGNEGDGISRLVREKCDFIVSIPMYGKIESMNVSSAGAVLMCECARQRHAGRS